MGFFSNIGRLFSGGSASGGGALSLREQMNSQIIAAYESARTTEYNAFGWKGTDGLSADAVANLGVRKTIRERARLECQQNSCYAKGIVQTLANDVIGRGPRLQVMTGDGDGVGHDDVDEAVEARFCEWGEAVGLAQKLRTMKIAKTADGETFSHFVTNPRPDMPVTLDFLVSECDQFTGDFSDFMKPKIVDGITFDDLGNPVSYHRLDEHPGSSYGGLQKGRRIPAKEVIHLFREDRAGQRRGVSEVAPALPLFNQLRRFTSSVMAAADAAARVGGVLRTNAAAVSDADDVDALDSIRFDMASMLTLPKGWDLTQIRSEHPATTYEMFKREILNEAARCILMASNIARGDSSRHNYSSGRLDHQTYFKCVAIEQDYFALHCLDRIFRAWLYEARRIAGYLPLDGIKSFYWDWIFDGTQHVDPAKEANAQQVRLGNLTTTLKAEYAAEGKDWKKELRQRAKEFKLIRELEIPISQAAPQPQQQQQADDDEKPVDDEEATRKEAA